MAYTPALEPFATVLHVDDDWATLPPPPALEALRLYLRWCGFDVHTESSLTIEKVHQRLDTIKPRPSVLLIDIMDAQGKPTGEDVMKRFRDLDVVVIGFSVLEQKEKEVIAIEQSMIPVIPKRLSPSIYGRILSRFPQHLIEKADEKMRFFGLSSLKTEKV